MVLDRGYPRAGYAIAYGGAAACIAGLALLDGSGGLYLLSGATAFFIFGAQLITFSLAPAYYPQESTGTGTGAMVSIGRLGSVLGPLIVGLLLHSGLGADTVLLSLVPICLLSPLFGIAFVQRLMKLRERGRPAFLSGDAALP
jgi:nitrate/nitrite transporter NarK